MGLPGEATEEQYQAALAAMTGGDQSGDVANMPAGATGDMSGLYGLMGMGAMNEIGQDDDEEYISEDEFNKQLDDQEKTIFNALVSSLLQNYMINLKKFLKRRMDHLKK